MHKTGRLKDDVGERWIAEQLCFVALATGILDAVSYPAYGIFLSNQTGNTIFLIIAAFGLSDINGRLPDTATSLGVFLAFLLIAGQIGNHIGRRRRWWLLLSHLIQTGLILLTAILEVTKIINDTQASRYVAITLLSAGSGMQVAMAKTLNCPEIPTAMLTSPYADLLTDPRLFTRGWSTSRDRRVSYIICLCSGVAIGAALYRYVSESSAVFLAGGIKALVTASFLFNPALNSDGERTASTP